jgi:hypothetical protein
MSDSVGDRIVEGLQDFTETLKCYRGESLEKLYSIIAIHPLAVGIHTYPHADKNNQRIHAGCEELERQGRIYRKTDEPNHCFWLPTKQEDTTDGD